ncbi:MAG: pseudaminic acid synthase [Bacteriovorax sp.]|nr:pseudaminic acid synthase [Bacteriovorax sp.]
MKNFKIGRHEIGLGKSTFLVAEMSGNHGGKIEKAIEIIHAAKAAGADAIKLQTYTADTITLKSSKPDFKLPPGPWEDYSTLHDLYQEAYTPWEWHEQLFNEARKIGLDIFSSPFDHTAVDFLEQFNPTVYKLASPEITDIPLIAKMAQTGKPIIISSGIATLEDLELAVETLRANGCDKFIMLKCTTAYPSPLDEVNLRTMVDMAQKFDCFVGVSDHTLGTTVPLAATTLGASMIEKHFTITKAEETVDSFFSLDQEEFSQMVTQVRNVELCLGKVDYELSSKAKLNLGGRRSLYISKNMSKGDIITPQNVRSVRPSHGLHPKYYSQVLGKKVKCDLEIGDRLTLEAIEL